MSSGRLGPATTARLLDRAVTYEGWAGVFIDLPSVRYLRTKEESRLCYRDET